MSLKLKTISGVKWTTFSTITIAAIAIIQISILARFLDTSDFGLMALITFILGFMDLFMDVGLSSAILHNQDISENEYASLYWINIIFSFILFTLSFLLSPYISIFLSKPEFVKLFPIMASSILLNALGRQFKIIKQKKLDFKSIAIIDITGALVGLVAGVFSALKGFGVYALVYSSMLRYAISNGLYFINGIKERRLVMHFKLNETKNFLKIGIYQVGGQLLNYLNRDLDVLLIGKFFGSEILGGYSLAKQLVQRPMQIINPIISNIASPVLSTVQNDKQNLKIKFLTILNTVATINSVIYALLAILAYPAILFLYGKNYTNIVHLMQILSLYTFLRSVGNPVGSLITATGRTDTEFYWNLFALPFFPVAIYIGSQYSVESVAFLLIITSILLLYPFWRFLIFKLCGASFFEYLNCYIPNLYRTYKNIKY